MKKLLLVIVTVLVIVPPVIALGGEKDTKIKIVDDGCSNRQETIICPRFSAALIGRE